MLRVRGILDEIHPGEVDPGVFRIYDAAGDLVGHAWRVNPGLRVIMYENYVKQVPGSSGDGYSAKDVTLTFKWSTPQIDEAKARDEWETATGVKPARYVQTLLGGKVEKHNP